MLGPALLVVLTWYSAVGQSGKPSVATRKNAGAAVQKGGAASQGQASVAKPQQPAGNPSPAPSPAKAGDDADLEVTCVVFRHHNQDTCLPSDVTAQPGPAGGANGAASQGSALKTGASNAPGSPATQQGAQNPMPSDSKPCLSDKSRRCLELGLGDHLRLKVKNLKSWVDKGNNPYQLILFLNERPLKGLNPVAVDVNASTVLFRLTRNADNKVMWDDLLGRATSLRHEHDTWSERAVRASIGMQDKTSVTSGAQFNLILIRSGWFIAFCAFFILFLGALVVMGIYTGMLRDSGDSSGLPANAKPPYSLARTQMAVWTFLIVCGFAFVWLITGDWTLEVPVGLIGLMGISSATFVGSVAVDSSKRNSALQGLPVAVADEKTLATDLQNARAANDQTLVELKTAQHNLAASKVAELKSNLYVCPSKWFLADILKDDQGYSLHRVQIAVWTLVLAVIFVKSVLETLALPAFSNTLLGLLGVSAGTYIGFKFPEK